MMVATPQTCLAEIPCVVNGTVTLEVIPGNLTLPIVETWLILFTKTDGRHRIFTREISHLV